MFVRMQGSLSRSIAEAVDRKTSGCADTFELRIIVTGSITLAGSIAGAEMP